MKFGVSHRLNVFIVYVLAVISTIMIVTQLNLLSAFEPRRIRARSHFESKANKSSSSTWNYFDPGELHYERFEYEYPVKQSPNLVVARAVNSTESVGKDSVTVDSDYDVTTVSVEDNSHISKHNSTGKAKDDIESSRAMKEGKDRPVILLWTTVEGYTIVPDIPEVPICGGGCQTSENRTDFNKSDAIVFTMKGMDPGDLPEPKWRRPDQVLVWWSEESPWTSLNFYERNFTDIPDNYLNWTMTFRKDSDVNAMMIPYVARDYVMRRLNEYKQKNPEVKKEINDQWQVPYDLVDASIKTEREVLSLMRRAAKMVRRKTKLVAWVASNCGYTAGAALRMEVVRNLTDLGLSIDSYGECGVLHAPDLLSSLIETLSDYKFYLAFENGLHCRDYLSEKFWYNSLYAGSVPVIWGPLKSDVEAVAPPHSFIHYDDFGSESELVEYLLELSTDHDAYMKYFSWWWTSDGDYPVRGVNQLASKMGEVDNVFNFELNAFCHLCYLLNDGAHRKYRKTIPSISEWWYKDENEVCLHETHKVSMQKIKKLKKEAR